MQGLEGCGKELDFILNVMGEFLVVGGEELHGSVLYSVTPTTIWRTEYCGLDGNKKPVLQLEGYNGGGLDEAGGWQ